MAAMAALSEEAAGQRYIRSINGTYLHGSSEEWKVDMAPHCERLERWYVQDHQGKVVLKTTHVPGRFLHSHPDGSVDLFAQPEEWTPIKNEDGSWSLQNRDGTWLSAHRTDGSLCTVPEKGDSEHFWLERW